MTGLSWICFWSVLGTLAETVPKVPVWEDEGPREPKLLRKSAEIRACGGRSPWMWVARQSRLSAFGLQGGTFQARCHRRAARVEWRDWRRGEKAGTRTPKAFPGIPRGAKILTVLYAQSTALYAGYQMAAAVRSPPAQ